MEFLSLSPLVWLLLLAALVAALRYSLVDQSVWRQAIALLFRGLAIVALIFGLCRPYWLLPSEAVHLLLLVDVSHSVDLEGINQAADLAQQAIDQLEPEDSWSLFAVGSETRPLNSPAELRELAKSWEGAFGVAPLRGESRLAEAMLDTRFAFPAGKAKRLVLMSDGRETAANAGTRNAGLDATLDQLAEESVDVQFKMLPSLQEAEVGVTAISTTTPTAFRGEVVRMRAAVTSNRKTKAEVRLIHKGVVEQRQQVELKPDETNYVSFDVEMRSAGINRYSAEVAADTDYFPLNNTAATTLTVRGEPRVLVLHQEPRDMRPLARALKEQGIDLDVRGRLGLPNSLEEVLTFDAVVLADLPATDLSPRQMQMLKRYVIDFGGGLVMLGSENSFGLGGYFKTPVEEVLPLVSRFEKEKEKPALAMMLVIDKSGSMQGTPIELARQAAKAAAELLSLRDLIGVIGFDGAPHLICELRSAADVDAIQGSIDSLQASGGTYLYPAMLQARDMLETAPAKIRHMIVLSDGHTQAADHHSLAQEAADAGITVSTVALGGADKQLLSSIAELGQGRYYETDDPSNVPQIFTKETMQASKSAIKEDLYAAVQTGDHPMLAGSSDSEIPFSLGYVMTEAKATAQLLLAAETGDPLLAIGRYGLGTGLAYTSDLTERWGGEWLAWDGCGKFWAQVLRSVLRKTEAEGMRVESQIVGDEWQLRLRRTDEQQHPVNQVSWNIALTDENDKQTPVEVTQTGLGSYVARAPLAGIDRASVRLLDEDFDKLKVVHWQRPYPAEYSLANRKPGRLENLATFNAEEVRTDLKPVARRKPIAHYAYMASLAFLLAGVLLRRI